MNATEFMFTELSGLESFFRESICVGFFPFGKDDKKNAGGEAQQ